MEFDEVAVRLDALATHLTGPAARAALSVPAARAFGAGAGGELAALASALHAQCAAAMTARERDATILAGAAGSLATSMRSAATAYRDLPDHHHGLGDV
jgi:hypothetical protein